MRNRTGKPGFAVGFLSLLGLAPAFAQQSLSLSEAVEQALKRHPSLETTAAAVDAAGSRVEGARGSRLPRVNVQESLTRGNNPVYVFGSLLTQHEFGPQNFAIDSLNRPAALNNMQSVLTVDEMLYDGGRSKSNKRAAEIGREMRLEEQRGARMNVMARVAQTYAEAVLSGEYLAVAEDAVRSAEADLRRAEDVRKSGMSTDADVLAIRVHLAAMREQRIRRNYERDNALAALNEAMGMPLTNAVRLSSPLAVTVEAMPGSGIAQRPEVRTARLSADLSDVHAASARTAYRPEAGLRFAWEMDSQQVVLKTGANWMAGVTLRWNLFNGFADRAAVREAAFEQAKSRSQEREVKAGIELQVRRASNALQAAKERVVVEEASVAMAEENLRIVRNRYESGLTTVTELLRSEVAVAEVRSRRLAASADVRLAAVATDMAEGTLAPGSGGLK